MSMNIGSQIVSKLGSTNSRIPLAIKDACDSAGYTYFSYDAGGKVEGRDRLFDEVGTGAIWLFGIPTFKKIIDKTIFKMANIDPEVDVRILKDKDVFKKALENAPTKEIKNKLANVGQNISKTKNLNILKFAMALGLTMLSYLGLTKVKQAMTKRNIEKEFLEKQMNKSLNNEENNFHKLSDVFSEFEQKPQNNTPSFGSAKLLGIAQDIMLDPMKNMLILDGTISAERLYHSRTKGEFAENAIKEGSFLFFIYGADKAIKKGINTFSEKILKAPIDLEVNLLNSGFAKNILKDKNIQNEIKEFSKKFYKSTSPKELYDFILNNQEHSVVKAAKASGIIKTIDGAIDTRKYIDPKELNKLTNGLTKFIDTCKTSKQPISKYLNKIKGLKVASTLLNVATCCFFLGYIVPKTMYTYRKNHQNGNNDFHVKTEYEKELAAKHTKTL